MACNHSTIENKSDLTTDSIKTVTVDNLIIDENEVTSDDKMYNQKTKETEIVIKNKGDYSAKFIQGLKGLGYEKFELMDSVLLINGTDTAYFPEIPKIGKQIVLTGIKDNLAVVLTVNRFNYTTIDYKIEMVEFGKEGHIQSGQADIISSFFFGAESDESEKTGNVYFVTEFSEFREEDCYTYIRLGYEEETEPYLLGKIKKNCNGEIMNLNLDNFSLFEK